jgi:hypothetical protein
VPSVEKLVIDPVIKCLKLIIISRLSFKTMYKNEREEGERARERERERDRDILSMVKKKAEKCRR